MQRCFLRQDEQAVQDGFASCYLVEPRKARTARKVRMKRASVVFADPVNPVGRCFK